VEPRDSMAQEFKSAKIMLYLWFAIPNRDCHRSGVILLVCSTTIVLFALFCWRGDLSPITFAITDLRLILSTPRVGEFRINSILLDDITEQRISVRLDSPFVTNPLRTSLSAFSF
jgi:hypothetical protein